MKKVLSLVLCLVLTLTLIPYGINFDVTANAEGLDQIAENQTWHNSWDGSKKYVYLKVSESGYYDFTMINHKDDSGIVNFTCSNITNYVEDNFYYAQGIFNYGPIDNFSEEKIYLDKDSLYEIIIEYGQYDDDWNLINTEAEISFVFTKIDYSPVKLNLGNNVNLTVGNSTKEILEFKTSTTGDYLFSLNNYVDFGVYIFEKNSGKMVANGYFYENSTKLRLNLKANTEYIIYALSYEKSTRLVRFSVSKANKNVTKIDIASNEMILPNDGFFDDGEASLYSSDIESFTYKVTYSDKTTETFTYYGLRQNGFGYIGVEYTGIIICRPDGESFFGIGYQPVIVSYMYNQESTSQIYISSYLEYFSYLNSVSDFGNMRIEYEDENTHTYYWRIKPKETNVYAFYSSYWDDFSYLNRTIFDANNNIIPENSGTWCLKSGQEYILRVSYTYDEYCCSDVIFWLETYREHNHSYKNACDKDCNVCGNIRTAPHKYSHNCDTTCNLCGAKRKITHTYKNVVTKATLTKNGKISYKCSVCGYTASKTTTVKFAKTFALSTTNYTYDGKAKKPTVTVKDSAGKVLKKDTDYTVTYPTSCTNAGTYKVTVKMKGNYSGTKTLTYKINPASISKCKITLSKTSYTYDRKAKKPTVTVKDSAGKVLKKDTDYTVTYPSSCTSAGTYKVTVKMKGNYTGAKTLTYKINPAGISKCKISLSKTSYTYDGKVKTPTVTVKDSAGKTISFKYYTVTYDKGRTNVGSYKVTIKFKGNYSGTKTLTFKIKPIDISKCKIKAVGASFNYNGKKQTPKITVKNASGKTLKLGTDYTLSYSGGSKNVGKYTVTVKMKGKYTGTKKYAYTIFPKGTSLTKVEGRKGGLNVYYNKQTAETTGYQIQYSLYKNFANDTILYADNSRTAVGINNLKKNYIYHVRVRTYKVVNGTKYFSAWSKYMSAAAK